MGLSGDVRRGEETDRSEGDETELSPLCPFPEASAVRFAESIGLKFAIIFIRIDRSSYTTAVLPWYATSFRSANSDTQDGARR